MKGFVSIIIFIGSLVLASGCQSISQKDITYSTFRQVEIPLQQNIPKDQIEERKEPAGIITLDDAMEASLKANPGLAAAWYNIKAFDGVIQQAGTLPNPTLSGEIEEFGGSGEFSGSGAMSSRIGISQEIPIAGQTSRRIKVAKAQKDIAVMEYFAKALSFKTEVKKRFLMVYILQDKLKLEEENLAILSSLKDGVTKRVTAGEASPLEEVKVLVQFESADITVERAKRELEAAKYELAASWAGELPQFTEVKSAYDTDILIPDEKKLLEQLKTNPTYGITKKRMALSKASIDLARSEAWTDIEVGGGIQRFNETDDHAYFLEVSIPIPLFNRNKGNIEEAVQTHNKTSKEFEAGLIELKTDLIKIIRRLHSVRKAFFSMQNTVMPAAKQVFDSVSKAYQVGEQGYLELLEAQRAHLSTRREHLELFNELQALVIEIDGYTDESLQETTVIESNRES